MVVEYTASDLETALQRDTPPTVIDVRGPDAYRAGHIPGAINLPYDSLPAALEDADIEWDSVTEVVVVCQKGVRSLKAARLIAASDMVSGDTTVASLADGYENWDGSRTSTA